MIKIENCEVLGWEHAIRGMRNPMNSWHKSDSAYKYPEGKDEFGKYLKLIKTYSIGENDLDLMKRLSTAGTDHSKYLRMIIVYLDITAPLYWWKEFDTYKVGTVANSCSTMHKIQAKEFTLDDFSIDKLSDDPIAKEVCDRALSYTLYALNWSRNLYLHTNDKSYWWQMIQLLPSSYNQKRTIMLNYQVLKNIYKSRKTHKLDEWREFCSMIKTLPYSELITDERGDINV